MSVIQKVWFGNFDHEARAFNKSLFPINGAICLAKTLIAAGCGYKVTSMLRIRPVVLGNVAVLGALSGLLTILISERYYNSNEIDKNQHVAWRYAPWVLLAKAGLISVSLGVFGNFNVRSCLDLVKQTRDLARQFSIRTGLKIIALDLINLATLGLGLFVSAGLLRAKTLQSNWELGDIC